MLKNRSSLKKSKRNTKVSFMKKDKNSPKWKKNCNRKYKNKSKLIRRSLKIKISQWRNCHRWSKTQKKKKHKSLKRTLKAWLILWGASKIWCKLKSILIQNLWKCINTCLSKTTVWKSNSLKFSQTKVTKKQKEIKKVPQYFTQIRVKSAHQNMLLSQITKTLQCKKERKHSQMKIKSHHCTWTLLWYQTHKIS